MSKKMWGGRFAKTIDPLLERFSKSIHYDYKLAEYDTIGSMAHVAILRRAGYLTRGEAIKLNKALKLVYNSIVKGSYRYDASAEDVHTDIQNKLFNIAGEAALRLQTARSRNDQVVLATKMYCSAAVTSLADDLAALQGSLLKLSSRNKDLILPGFTHMQHAQVIFLKDYLSAYSLMFGRDRERLLSIRNNIRFTMGAGSLAGTPIDHSKYDVSVMGYKIEAVRNSVYSVSDRDFVIEVLSALSIAGAHISRMAEDFVLYSTKEFDFIEIDEAYCTGSSLMPQKKNADSLELIRGFSGRLYGNLVSVLTMIKGLPLSYNRDMQLDKEPLFSSVDIVSASLKILSGIVSTLTFNIDKIEEHLEDESLYATDMVYYLVDKGVPFKIAHTIVGKIVKYSIDNHIDIKSMSECELKKFSDKFKHDEVLRLFNPRISVKMKRSIKRR